MAAVIVALTWIQFPATTTLTRAASWQSITSPGPLSQAHAHLESNCSACHTPFKGVLAASCVVCHANDESLLKRQSTAFHASIGSCGECHREHEGPGSRPVRMDHAALVQIGLRNLNQVAGQGRSASPNDSPRQSLSVHHGMSALACASCHGNQDPHFQFFGNDCAECHNTDRWTIPEFRHPAASSLDCAECHQAPPSHYMEHFEMISVPVAKQEHANVTQCYLCHQTSAWNDIKGIGFYKHH